MADKLARGGFHLLVTAAQITRRPIQLTKTVQNRALDAVLGVAGKRDLLIRIELAGGVEQTENTGVNQIVEIHMHGKIFVHANRDGLHQRQMLQNNAVAACDFAGLADLCVLGFRLHRNPFPSW